MANQVTGWSRLINAARYSWQGLVAAWKNEAAFRQEIVVGLVAVVIAILLPVSLLSKLLLICVSIAVIVVELLNSAIEAVVDRFGGEYHELSGRAKDLGSAAVLVALLLAAVVWLVILYTTFIGS